MGLGLQMCVLESLKEAFRWRHVSLVEEGKGKPGPHTRWAVTQQAGATQRQEISYVRSVTSYLLLSGQPATCVVQAAPPESSQSWRRSSVED